MGNRKKTECEKCGAECCRYINVKISSPRTRADRDEHRWLLMHKKVQIRIENRRWYLLVQVPCRHLTKRNRCDIYPVRPDMCEDFEDCEFRHGINEDTIAFTTVEEYDAYMAARNRPWRPRERDE